MRKLTFFLRVLRIHQQPGLRHEKVRQPIIQELERLLLVFRTKRILQEFHAAKCASTSIDTGADHICGHLNKAIWFLYGR